MANADVIDELRASELEHYRREAMGAFAHEVRTPLTSIRMVMELARRQSSGGQLLLDSELATMLSTSVDDLQRLADDLQETSRLERGKLTLSPGPCNLRAAIEAARGFATRDLVVEGESATDVQGPWDAARLVRAISGFVEAANRIGDGCGVVRIACSTGVSAVEMRFESGERGTVRDGVAADAGFAFFRS
ncbi:MAG: histidine kinase dimerization/phospho-acceptor domain-containing protein, partial [Tepidiformaceae bacterium]